MLWTDHTICCRVSYYRDMIKRISFIGLSVIILLLSIVSPLTGQEENPLRMGDFELISGVSGIVIAAPHGLFDSQTDKIVQGIAKKTNISGIIARGFYDKSAKRRLNVNRPTEDYFDKDTRVQGFRTERAKIVFEEFERLVKEVSRGDILIYIEIHGNKKTETANLIDTDTIGVTYNEALEIKKAFDAIKQKTIKDKSNIPDIVMRIHPVDKIYWRAAMKTEGVFRLAQRVLHFELPQSIRLTEESRNIYIDILSELIIEATNILKCRTCGQ